MKAERTNVAVVGVDSKRYGALTAKAKKPEAKEEVGAKRTRTDKKTAK